MHTLFELLIAALTAIAAAVAGLFTSGPLAQSTAEDATVDTASRQVIHATMDPIEFTDARKRLTATARGAGGMQGRMGGQGGQDRSIGDPAGTLKNSFGIAPPPLSPIPARNLSMAPPSGRIVIISLQPASVRN